MNHDAAPGNTTTQLPPYRGLVAVDCIQFSKNRSVHLPDLSAAIPQVLERALALCDIPQVWESRRFSQDTGDGFIFGVKTRHIPHFIDGVLPRLQDVLFQMAPGFRAKDRNLNLRLRVSIHIGPIYDAGDRLRDRKSEPTVHACRLLDSTSLKSALKHSDPDVTYVGAIISQRVFEDVVSAGYTQLKETEFEQVTAEVPDKEFSQSAWLYIPRRSGNDRQATTRDQKITTQTTPSIPSSTAIFHGNVGGNITAGHISDGVHIELPEGFFDTSRRRERED
ncbi:hypothetical protein AB0L53_09365 [Nonomuraea sp. NPDC052129]|uniref:hypothetical protein n=1 Tax=Nonomuraea sp. NPDC052129 TaxID=3154651 RepID=UPI00342ED788